MATRFEVLKQTIEHRDTRAGRLFDGVVQSLIVLTLIVYSLDTLPDLPRALRVAIDWIEWVVIILFALEYAVRVVVADRALRFVFSFYGIIDLLAFLPALLTGADLRALRAFRLLRLFKIYQFSPAINRFRKAFAIVRDELILFGSSAAIVLFVTAVGIYLFERDAQPEAFASVFHALWWAVVTLTTVGYGDVYPITLGGKVFTFFVLIVGIGVVAIPTGLITSALSQVRSQEMMQEEKRRAVSMRERQRD